MDLFEREVEEVHEQTSIRFVHELVGTKREGHDRCEDLDLLHGIDQSIPVWSETQRRLGKRPKRLFRRDLLP